MLKKIVFIGPESSGKTTMCIKLAEQLNTIWVPEACRLASDENFPFDLRSTSFEVKIISANPQSRNASRLVILKYYVM